MKENINTTFSEEEIKRLSTLIGKKIKSLHHDEFTLGNLSIQKIGIRCEDKIYALQTDYKYVVFLWGEEGVAKLHFVESTEANLIVSATPPIKYVNETINDIVEDVIIVRDEIEEFVDGQSIGTFIYDKGIILVFKDYQIGIELDSWMAEMIAVFRSSNALSKFTPLDYEWGDDGHASNCRFEAKRFQISLTKWKQV